MRERSILISGEERSRGITSHTEGGGMEGEGGGGQRMTQGGVGTTHMFRHTTCHAILYVVSDQKNYHW